MVKAMAGVGKLLSGGSRGVRGKIKEISYEDGAGGDDSPDLNQW